MLIGNSRPKCLSVISHFLALCLLSSAGQASVQIPESVERGLRAFEYTNDIAITGTVIVRRSTGSLERAVSDIQRDSPDLFLDRGTTLATTQEQMMTGTSIWRQGKPVFSDTTATARLSSPRIPVFRTRQVLWFTGQSHLLYIEHNGAPRVTEFRVESDLQEALLNCPDPVTVFCGNGIGSETPLQEVRRMCQILSDRRNLTVTPSWETATLHHGTEWTLFATHAGRKHKVLQVGLDQHGNATHFRRFQPVRDKNGSHEVHCTFEKTVFIEKQNDQDRPVRVINANYEPRQGQPTAEAAVTTELMIDAMSTEEVDNRTTPVVFLTATTATNGRY